ncbi:hypothetical protein ACZ90_00410 [Streptomyces albus subsp. albus]|nr:hypothetical protein ACZ90_00410 [Streptomyces albus subsp. albus]
MAFVYQETTLDEYARYAAEAFARGGGLQITFDPADGTFTGIMAIPSGTAFARQVAKKAERRASTLNL